MKNGFWDLFKQYCLESTIIGLKYFYLYPDKFSRCYWSINMCGSAVFAVILTMLLYRRFNQMPTRIAIENQFAPLSNLPWPAITICSPNQITISNMIHFNRTLVDGNLSLDLHETLPQLLGFYEMLPKWNENQLHHLQQLIDLNRHTVPEVTASLAQSCERFLKFCVFQGQIRNCSELFRPILTVHGVCCTFNNRFYFRGNLNNKLRNFTTSMARADARSLLVISDYEPWDALNRTLLNAGAIRVMLHDWTELPANDESCLVYPHAESFHSIHGIHTYCSDEVQRLPPQSRRCLFEDEGRDSWEKTHGYRNSDCDQRCFMRAVKKRCGCLLLYALEVFSAEICNVTSIPCIMQTKQELADIDEIVSCDCPRDCDSRQYKADLNTGDLAALPFVYHKPYGNLQFNKSTILQHFAFSNQFYVVQKQETVMSLINLVSNLGGVFGLCMGCSVFSVLEILFFIYKAIKNFIKNRPNRRRVPPKEY